MTDRKADGDRTPCPFAPNRRDALRQVGGACLAATLGGCTIAEVFTDGAEAEDIVFSLADPTYAPLQQVGGMVAVDSGPLKIVIIRADMQTIVALDRICTHTACDMGPDEWGAFSEGQLICGCHGSFFAIDGTRISGPATADLNAYEVELDFPNQAGVVRVPQGASTQVVEGDGGMGGS